MDGGLDIDHVARLARLRLTEDERARYAVQLNQVLGHFASLAALPPGAGDAAPEVDAAALRADAPGPTLTPDDLLRNAPAGRDGQVLVPRVVDDAS